MQPVEAWRQKLIAQGVREWPSTGEAGMAATGLLDFHPDPADRFITADDRILTWSGTPKRYDARQ